MNSKNQDRMSRHEIIVLVLSIYVLVALLVRTVVRLSPDNDQLLDQIDFYICLFFLYDFARRFYLAEDKWAFMRWGWIDLLSSIPAFDWFRWGRMVRILRILPMIRAFRSTRSFLTYLFRNRAEGTLTVVLLTAVLLMLSASIAILNVETVPESNIKTPSDALWWAFVTITTVGYGDKFPVTTAGRLIAALLMVVGVGLFGTFTGYLAKFFVNQEQEKEDNDLKTLLHEVRELRQKIEELENRMR
ncbi:potassium channel family protein [Larkinella harenae]